VLAERSRRATPRLNENPLLRRRSSCLGRSVIDVWDEARDEHDGLAFSLRALGEAIWIYGTCRDRDAALLPTHGHVDEQVRQRDLARHHQHHTHTTTQEAAIVAA
jgi:hypothetical protein